MTNARFLKFFQYFIPIFITIVLWFFARIILDQGMTGGYIFRYISQIISLLSVVLLSICYILTTRIPYVEKMYGGLDKTYKTHATLGKIAVLFAFFHPVFLVLQYAGQLGLVNAIVSYFWFGDILARNFGILSLYAFVLLILLTIFRFMPYEVWKYTHKLMAIPYIAGIIHMVLAPSDIKDFAPLRYWMLFISFAGIYSIIYKFFLYEHLSPKFLYDVVSLKNLGVINEIYLRPVNERLNFEPGEFVYFKVTSNPLISKEDHPFSISSNPHKNFIRISYKTLGDYTLSLSNLRVGDKANLYGPYGEFSSYMFNKYTKQIWIAGGIGVTPFLSMLSFEAHNEETRHISFFYSNNKPQEAVYHDEISNIIKVSDDYMYYENYICEQKGFLTAKYISEKVPDLKEYAILICGPSAMMKSLRDQFIKLGVPKRMIIFENFSMV